MVIQVRTNAAYRPAWVGRVPMLRAVFRLLPYLAALWSGIGRAQVVHVFANSGWAWHLLAWPAVVVARWRGVPLIVNYRGGLADEFLTSAPRWVRSSLASVSLRVVPSRFLLGVFARHGLNAEIIPNIIDLSRFKPASRRVRDRAAPDRHPQSRTHLRHRLPPCARSSRCAGVSRGPADRGGHRA